MEQVDELHLDDDPVTEAFFSAPPPPVEILVHEWDPPAPLAREHLRAMQATWLIFAGSVLALGGFLVHQKVIMPTPVELGAAAPEIHWTIETAPVVAQAARPAAVTAVGAAPDVGALEAPSAPEPVAAAVVGDAVVAAAAALAPERVGAGVPQSQAAPQRVRGTRPVAPPRATRAPANEADRVLQAAHAALRVGSARIARGHAVDALAVDPTRADAYIVLGAARASLGDVSGAQQAYRLCAERALGPRASACKALVR